MSAARSGFVCLVGRPNSGKSTLTNALVGEKVAITSTKPQTTRHTIRAIIDRGESQLVLVDTPGIHRPRTLLGQRLNESVRDAYSSVDVIAMCLPADEKCGAGDAFIAQQIADSGAVKRVAIITKSDLGVKAVMPQRLMEVMKLATDHGFVWDEIIPVSAKSGDQTELLVSLLVKLVPEGGALYPAGQITDEPEDVMIAELIREAALEGVRDELPHSIAVVVEEVTKKPDSKLINIQAFLYVERPSQKSIVIGTAGARLKEVGTNARKEIERYLGAPIYLDLRVKVAKEWQRDPKALDRLGF
ncbi:MAG TPA: GTPase Era [Candidatus Nanopelagicaceae bacterium]|nr:GTPase Era [Candidatus Nanopelagicaceae bacterium]